MAIEVGDAIWRIGGDDAALQRVLKGTARSVAEAGTAVAAAWGKFATDSVKKFVTLGDQIDKMSSRTGFSAKQLSILKHAAEQGGASLNDIEKASKKLAMTIFEAGEGTETYTDALKAVGLRYENLAGLNPEDQFMKVALALADVEHAGTKAALAQQIFGKAGTELLPMLEGGSNGLKEMAAEAELLGIVMDDDAADSAAMLTDLMDELQKAFDGIQYAVAQALMPIISKWVERIRDVVIDASLWIRNNQELTATIVKVATAAAAFLAIIGPGVIAATFGPLAAKVALVAAAIAALGYILWESIGGWEGVGKIMGWVSEKVSQAKDWLLANWDQISRIFDHFTGIIGTTLRIFKDVVYATVGTVASIISGFVGGATEDWWALDGETASSTGSVLDEIEAFGRNLERLLNNIEYKVSQFVINIQSYWEPLRAFFAELGSWGFFTGAERAINPLAPIRDWGWGAMTGMASGGTVQQSGWAVVGERGPELVNMPRGATVYDAQQTQSVMTGAPGTPSITLNFGRDSVRSDDDIRYIERSISDSLRSGLVAAGVRT